MRSSTEPLRPPSAPFAGDVTSQHAKTADEKLYAGIAAVLKASFVGFDRVGELKRHYQTMRLMDEKGAFIVAGLNGKGLADDFVPAAFIDQVVSCAAQSPCLNDLMREARGSASEYIQHADYAAMLPSATTYAVVLDRLTRVLRNDPRLLQALHDHFTYVKQEARFKALYKTALVIFEQIKVTTIDFVMLRYLSFHREHEIPYVWGRATLPLNILEAVIEDVRRGHSDNSVAGLVLMSQRPGIKDFDPKTHTGPTRFSDDGNAILYSVSLPQAWADLYSTWNLAFVAYYPNAPFFFAKLLNPQVLGYQKAPEEYLYNRAVALYLHLQWEVFRRVDGGHTPETSWADPKLMKLWSKVNRASARRYRSQVEKLLPSWGARRIADYEGVKELLKQLPSTARDLASLIAKKRESHD